MTDAKATTTPYTVPVAVALFYAYFSQQTQYRMLRSEIANLRTTLPGLQQARVSGSSLRVTIIELAMRNANDRRQTTPVIKIEMSAQLDIKTSKVSLCDTKGHGCGYYI